MVENKNSDKYFKAIKICFDVNLDSSNCFSYFLDVFYAEASVFLLWCYCLSLLPHRGGESHNEGKTTHLWEFWGESRVN